MQYKISPSILSADFTKMGQELDELVQAGIDSIHLDIMDNHYVPNLSFGPDICHQLIKHSPGTKFDVHIMAKPTKQLVDAFINMQVNSITIHPNQVHSVVDTISSISMSSIKVGMAINPDEQVEIIEPFLKDIQQVLIMSVYPGFGGQSFISDVLPKVSYLRELIDKQALDISIAIDGGINFSTITAAKQAGVDTFVIGSALLNSNDYKQAISSYRTLLNS